jgi:hypothetical protein
VVTRLASHVRIEAKAEGRTRSLASGIVPVYTVPSPRSIPTVFPPALEMRQSRLKRRSATKSSRTGGLGGCQACRYFRAQRQVSPAARTSETFPRFVASTALLLTGVKHFIAAGERELNAATARDQKVAPCQRSCVRNGPEISGRRPPYEFSHG